MPENQPGWHLPFGTSFGAQIHYYLSDAAGYSLIKWSAYTHSYDIDPSIN